jgi:DHA1 family inner membrane transport protein
VHFAFDIANAISPWVGGIAIAQGAVPLQTGFVAGALLTSGFIM